MENVPKKKIRNAMDEVQDDETLKLLERTHRAVGAPPCPLKCMIEQSAYTIEISDETEGSSLVAPRMACCSIQVQGLLRRDLTNFYRDWRSILVRMAVPWLQQILYGLTYISSSRNFHLGVDDNGDKWTADSEVIKIETQ